jgi:hypothetical protein
MKTLWTDNYISDLATQAEEAISTAIPCVYVRFPLNIVASQSIYSFQTDTSPAQRLTGIIRITWQGNIVYPMFQEYLRGLVGTLKPGEGEVTSSRPEMYIRTGYGMDQIKFFATPSATITYDSANINTKAGIRTNVIVSGWRIADSSGTAYRIPDYIRETLVRYSVLATAYKKEGKGQNLDASKYYEQQYAVLLDRFKKIVDQLFSSRTRGMKENTFPAYGGKPPRPRLPSNFGE